MDAVQCKMARAATGMKIRALAEVAGVAVDTIVRLERGEDLKAATVEKIQSALEAAGVEFIGGEGEPVGVQVRSAKHA